MINYTLLMNLLFKLLVFIQFNFIIKHITQLIIIYDDILTMYYQ